MKRKLYITLIALGLLTIACSEKFDLYDIPNSVVPSLKEYFLTIGQKEFVFPSTEYTANTTVNSSGIWNFTNYESWLTLTPVQGGEGTASVSLKALENSTTESRLSIFEIQAPENEDGWYASYTIQASQSAAAAYINVSNTNGDAYNGSVRIDGQSNTKEFFVDSNCDFTSSSDADWITVSEPVAISDTRKRITLNMAENTTSKERTAIVILSYDNGSAHTGTEIRVYQSPATINASADILNYTYVGGTGVITFDSQAEWKAYTNESFIEIVADNSTTFDINRGSSIRGNAGKGTFGINISRNPSKTGRNGTVYVTINEEDIIEIPIQQGNVTLSVPSSYHNLTFSSSMEESTVISVESNAAYNVTSYSDWLTFKNNNDGAVTVTAADNPDIQSRSTTMFVTSTEDGSLSQEITISQQGKTFELSTPSNASLTFGRTSAPMNIIIFTNAKWSATTEQDWITIENPGGTPGKLEYVTIPVKVSDNTSSGYRSGTVKISMEGSSQIINVGIYQDPAEIEVGTGSFTFGNKADTTTVYFNCNSPWNITTESEWIKVTPSSGSPSGATMQSFAIDIAVTENASTSKRSGSIIINMYEQQRIINISQESAYLNISQNSITFGNVPDTSEVSFRTNGPWTVKSDSDWIKVTPSGGTPDYNETGRFKISVTANNSANSRSGKVTVSMYDTSKDITVTQEGAYMQISTDSLIFNNKRSTQTLNFNTNGLWDATTNADWITVSPAAGAGNSNSSQKLSITVADNQSSSRRVGKIAIKMYDSTKEIKIIQDGAFIRISKDSLSFNHYASSQTLNFSTSGIWSAGSDSDWIVLSATSGAPDSNNEASLGISVTSNNTTAQRNGKVTVSMYDKTIIIKIHQSASRLSVSTEHIQLAHNNSSKQFSITTNTPWQISIEQEGEWLSVDNTSGGSSDKYESTSTYYVYAKATHNDENKERTGRIIIQSKSEIKVITVTQDPKYLLINSPALDFSATGGSCNITVTKATDEYYASSNADWVEVTKDSYYNRIKVNVLFNDSKDERTAIVTIENDYNKSYKLTLTQKGRKISVTESGAELFAKGGSATTTASVEGEFTVSTASGSWLTASHEAGSNKIVVTAQENETGAVRTDYVTVSLAGQPDGEEVFSKQFVVKQHPYTNRIDIDGFEGADKDVKHVSGKGFSIKITTYTTDKDYNKQDSSINPGIGGYGDDKGKDKNGNGSINIGGYGDDKNWNN